MIFIKEDISKKSVGETSLFISFKYDPNIVDIIKRCEIPKFDGKNKVWEVPLSELSYLLDELCKIDEIHLELYDKKEEETEDLIIPNFKTNPFKYQLEGIQYGLKKDKWLLLDAPGLGKTLQILYIAETLKKNNKIEHCLIICGINTLKTNWKKEIEKHSNLDCKILGERIKKNGKVSYEGLKERLEDLKNPITEFFTITNIETLRNNDIVKLINSGPNKFGMIVVDEIHTCFDYDTYIDTDVGKLKIGDIIENKLECKILSYNFDTNKNEFKKIKDYHKYASLKQLKLTFLDDKNNEIELICTSDHLIFTENRGWVRAEDLLETDIIKNYNFYQKI